MFWNAPLTSRFWLVLGRVLIKRDRDEQRVSMSAFPPKAAAAVADLAQVRAGKGCKVKTGPCVYCRL
jgi:hypothetical protein